MIQRISRTNDLKDKIKSCPGWVVEDITSIKYYTYGNEGEIEPEFTLEGDILVVRIPSQLLSTLEEGVLYRKAYFTVDDSSYPDGHYDLEIVDDMNVWLV